MTKSQRAGIVKRRLAREIGTTAATRFSRTCLAHTLLKLAGSTRWRTLLAVASDLGTTPWSGVHRPRRIERLRQGNGDLGRRMQHLFRRLPPGPVLIVGCDIPGISAEEIAKAFRLLGNADAVLGPAADGGYWLVGLRRSPRVLVPFAGVRWSSPEALADTLRNLKGRRVGFAATLADVDTADDLVSLRQSWQRLIPPRSAG